MKTFFMLLAGIGFSITGYSQYRDTVIVIPRGNDGKILQLSPKAKWQAENKLGNIYRLPLDNMACMVPDLKNITPIPTKKLFPGNSKMPNKIPK